MAEASAQNGAGGAEQDVRGRDQALHNPSAQGQGPNLIASRRRRWWGLRRRRRRRLRRRRRSPVAVRVTRSPSRLAVQPQLQLQRRLMIVMVHRSHTRCHVNDCDERRKKKCAHCFCYYLHNVMFLSTSVFVSSDNNNIIVYNHR